MAEITVYSKPNCMKCDFTKQYLMNNSIPYIEINVFKNAKALAMLRDVGYSQMPVVDIDGVKHTGFRPDVLSKAVK